MAAETEDASGADDEQAVSLDEAAGPFDLAVDEDGGGSGERAGDECAVADLAIGVEVHDSAEDGERSDVDRAVEGPRAAELDGEGVEVDSSPNAVSPAPSPMVRLSSPTTSS